MSNGCELLLAKGAMATYRITTTDEYAETLRVVFSMTDDDLRRTSSDETRKGSLVYEAAKLMLGNEKHSQTMNELRRQYSLDGDRTIRSQHFQTIEVALGDRTLANAYIRCLEAYAKRRGLSAEPHVPNEYSAVVVLTYVKYHPELPDYATIESMILLNAEQVGQSFAEGVQIGPGGVSGVFRRVAPKEDMTLVVNCRKDLGTVHLVIPPDKQIVKNYIVTTQTGPHKDGDPTNSPVFCKLHGSNGSTAEMALNNIGKNDLGVTGLPR